MLTGLLAGESYSLLLESLRTNSPAPRSVAPPAASRTTSRPVNGSVPCEVLVGVVAVVLEAVLLETEQS
jgi:hypothetical protein